MSDSPPSAKRQRTEEPTAHEITPIRSKIWMPFGDLVLQVESTQFRVNRDILARHSPVFAGMLSVPQPPDEPTLEGCPIVILSGDSAKDWELLLEALYEPIPLIGYRNKLFNDVERSDDYHVVLHPELKKLLAVGFEKMMTYQLREYEWLENDTIVPSSSCVTLQSCIRRRVHLRRVLTWNKRTANIRFFMLHAWQDDWGQALCNRCAKAFEDTFIASGAKAWEALPAFFGFSGWAELTPPTDS
ncbi:hypothetical protein FB45DRAFT_1002125 [Roridomyces roridus]|uniref:BTB domain-containing protein n=1 Tax=Roridomyces roridus TaxID=1738132 RepID=A0AAD7C059_9AGAR|nr:hypothetical protein FB45DRAFT_1002125 [Roridomyces roridus]